MEYNSGKRFRYYNVVINKIRYTNGDEEGKKLGLEEWFKYDGEYSEKWFQYKEEGIELYNKLKASGELN